MVTTTEVKCDVVGCKEDAHQEVKCCRGWTLNDEYGTYKKFENPTEPQDTDLCKKHWKQWSKITCKLLKMDKVRKE